MQLSNKRVTKCRNPVDLWSYDETLKLVQGDNT